MTRRKATKAAVSGEANKVGRPRKIVADEETLALLSDLAEIACTLKEAAAVFRVSESTMDSFLATFPEARKTWDDGHDASKTSLRRKLFKLADTNAAAAIFLAKNLLGMKDSATVAVELPVHNLTDDQLHSLATALGAPPPVDEGAGGDRAPETLN